MALWKHWTFGMKSKFTVVLGLIWLSVSLNAAFFLHWDSTPRIPGLLRFSKQPVLRATAPVRWCDSYQQNDIKKLGIGASRGSISMKAVIVVGLESSGSKVVSQTIGNLLEFPNLVHTVWQGHGARGSAWGTAVSFAKTIAYLAGPNFLLLLLHLFKASFLSIGGWNNAWSHRMWIIYPKRS
jgi:hypothetical protein